jgi:hypothetical protein
MVDTVANLALYFGLALALGSEENPPESSISFEVTRANFYACARYGLDAQVRWRGKSENVRRLLLETLLPDARRALEQAGISADDLHHFFDGVLQPRIQTGMNGAQWQRDYYRKNGRNFQALTERYAELQSIGAPVHSWPSQ